MAYNNLGNVYLAQRRFSEALAAYNKSIFIDPQLAAAYNGLGVTYYNQGEVNSALICWKKHLTSIPNRQMLPIIWEEPS